MPETELDALRKIANGREMVSIAPNEGSDLLEEIYSQPKIEAPLTGQTLGPAVSVADQYLGRDRAMKQEWAKQASDNSAKSRIDAEMSDVRDVQFGGGTHGTQPAPAPAGPGLDPLSMDFAPGRSSSTTSGIKVSKSVPRDMQEAARLKAEAAKLDAEAALKENKAALQSYGVGAAQKKNDLAKLDAEKQVIVAERDKLQASYQAEVAAAKGEEPDPDRRWNSFSSAQKVLLTLAQLFGARAQAVSGGRIKNTAKQWLESQIEQDIDLQEKGMRRGEKARGERKGMLGILAKRIGDIDAAKANLRVVHAQELEDRLKVAALSAKEPRIKGQLMQALSTASEVKAAQQIKLDQLTSSKTTSQRSTPDMYTTADGKKVSAQQLGMASKVAADQAKSAGVAAKPVKLGKIEVSANAAESYALKMEKLVDVVIEEGVKKGGLSKKFWDGLLGGTLGASQAGVKESLLFDSLAAQELRSQGFQPTKDLKKGKLKSYTAFGVANSPSDVATMVESKLDQQIAILEGALGTARDTGDAAVAQALEKKIHRIEQIKNRAIMKLTKLTQ